MLFLNHTMSADLGSDVLLFRIVASLVAIILALIIFKVVDNNKISRFFERRIGLFAAAVFVAGIVLYFIGFWSQGSAGNILTLMFRSVLSSLEMFVSHSDLIEVRHEMHENGVYMFVFSMVHFFAVLLSAICIIPLIAYVWRSNSVLKKLTAQKLFIFWGQSENSFILAKNIVKHEAPGAYKIVFVELPSDESGSEELHFRHLFNGSLVKNEKMETIRDIDALLINSRQTVLSKRGKNVSLSQVLEAAGLKKLYKAFLKKSVREVKIFFFSENKENNLENMATLIATTETTEKESVFGKKTDVYCLVRNSDLCTIYCNKSNHKIAEDKNSIQVHIVDSDALAVDLLKKDVACHPVSFVGVNTATATAESPFTAMIIGSDDTSRHAFRFLYEFSSLAAADGSKNPSRFYLFGNDAGKTEGEFKFNYPSLKDSGEIVFNNEPLFSAAFWESLESCIASLNYVVVSSGSDKDDFDLVTKIYQLACRRRDNMDKFGIFVRSYSRKYYQGLHDIAKFYEHSSSGGKIVVFGQEKDIFTYENIIDEERLEKAKKYYGRYAESAGDGKTWEQRARKLSTTYAEHHKLSAQQSQDIANTWHVATKLYLLGFDADDSQLTENQSFRNMLDCIKSRPDMKGYEDEYSKAATLAEKKAVSEKYSTYPEATEGQKIQLRNLARTEHLRWNALTRLLGYVATSEDIVDGEEYVTDHVAKKHGCIVDNKTLESVASLKKTIPYDCNVVDISFSLAYEELAKK